MRVCGAFDPLLAEHAKRLAQVRKPGQILVVEVVNPARPLLRQRARAELVAALSMVDYVVMSDRQSDGTQAIDGEVSQRFVEHVRERHRPALAQDQRA